MGNLSILSFNNMASHVLSRESGEKELVQQTQCLEKNDSEHNSSDEKREEHRDNEDSIERNDGDRGLKEHIDGEISKKRKRSMEELLLENDGLLKVNALLKQCVWLEEHSDMLMQQNKSLQPVNKEVREKNASVERSIKGMLAFLKGWAAKVGIKAPVFTSLPEDPIKEGEKSNDGDEGRDGCSNEECRIKNGDEEVKEHVENSARNYNIIGAEEREQKDNGEAKEHCDGDGEMGEPTDDEVLQRIRLVKELFLGKEPSVLRGNTFLVQYAVLKCKDDELDEQNEELWAERELVVKQMDLLKQQMDELSAFSKVLAAHSSRPIPDNLQD